MKLVNEATPAALESPCAKLFSNVRNEAARLPYFLDYYRNLGVEHFVIVDNDSTDNSLEYLQNQIDVSVYSTKESFRDSRCGLDWLDRLRDKYSVDQWCLTVDCDELIVFPLCETLGIVDLCQYLDLWNYEGLFTLMIDFYADKPLSEYNYSPGEPFTHACSYFDSEGYFAVPVEDFPYFGVFGGARYRAFYRNSSDSQGPTMRKIPLVRWKKGVRYRSVTHSTTKLRLADITGALLHFKYLCDFIGHSRSELERNDRNMNFYQKYVSVIDREPDLNLMSKVSCEYQDSAQLQKLGLIKLSKTYLHWSRPILEKVLGRGSGEIYDRAKSSSKINTRSEDIEFAALTGLWETTKGVASDDGSMSNNFTVTVIMPAFNAANFIGKAIESVLIQPEVKELIIVEDSSTDNTLEICREFEAKNNLVKVVQHEDGTNKGAGESRNLGIANATSDYIAFLDADDFYAPGRFKLTRKLFAMRPDIDGVYGAQGFHFYSESLKQERKKNAQAMKITLSEYVPPENLFCSMGPIGKSGWFHGNTITVRREVFDRVGLFWDNRQEDVHMWLRMALLLKLVPGEIKTPVSYKGVHDNNRMSSEVIRNFRRQVLESIVGFAIHHRATTEQLEKLVIRYFAVIMRESDGTEYNSQLKLIEEQLDNREDGDAIIDVLKSRFGQKSIDDPVQETHPDFKERMKSRLKHWIRS